MKIKSILAAAFAAALSLMFTGCATTGSPGSVTITPAEVESGVSAAVLTGLIASPSSAQDLVVAWDIICVEAGKTNVSPFAIERDITAAGLTDQTARIAVAGAMLTYSVVYTSIGATNDAQMLPYVQAVCAGFTDALGAPNASARLKLWRSYRK